MRSSLSACPTLTANLRQPDRLLLWALRAWVIGLKRRVDVVEQMRAAFDRYAVRGAADLIDALMSVVACGATRVLDVECVCHEEVSEDEKRLLAAASLHQNGSSLEARFILRTMLSATASRDAAEILDRLGEMLRSASLRLSAWPLETERLVFGSWPKDRKAQPTIH